MAKDNFDVHKWNNQRKLEEANISETRFDTTQIKELLQKLEQYNNKTFIWFDTETTGFNFDRPLQITQIAALATDSQGNELGRFNEKTELESDIKPLASNPESGVSKALSINRYFDDTSDKREHQAVLKDFVEWVYSFSDPLLIMYNVPFDMEVFNTVTKGKRLKSITLDVMKLAQYFWIPLHQQLAQEGNERSKEILDILGTSGSGSLVGSTLSKISKALGIDASGAHDALADVTMTSKAYYGMLEDFKKYQENTISSDFRRGRISADRKFRLKDQEKRKKLKQQGKYTPNID
jgi:DNA polymerase III alpha subunit (gram-positive type)